MPARARGVSLLRFLLRWALANGLGQSGSPLARDVKETFVLGDAIEQGQELFRGHQALVFVGDLQLQQNVVNTQLFVMHGAIELNEVPLRFGNALEPIEQRLSGRILRVIELD